MDFATSDHYEVLGVSRTASEAEIANAYKALARIHHPDKNLASRDQAEVRFKRLAEAYAVLRDPESRRAFDESGARPPNMSYEEAERMWRSWGMGADDDGQRRQEDETRRKGIALMLLALAVCAAPQQLKQQALALCLRLLPGFAVSAVGVALLSSREEQSKWLWWALLLLMASYASRRMLGVGPGTVPTEVPNAPAVVGTPHSGELVLLEDGRLALVSDPAAPLGEPGAGWQQRLVGDMTDTIKRGQEQVVMVFSREGCPWCDRQLPVLERAIKGRAGLGGGAAAAPAAPAPAFALPALLGRAAVGLAPGGAAPMGRGAGVLFAPLRVFVFDAGEFPSMAQSFQVKAFPTTMAWGAPGVAPMVSQGYLDDANFDKLLRAVAQATPEGSAPEKKKKRGLFR